jgi:hypothetical protein
MWWFGYPPNPNNHHQLGCASPRRIELPFQR